MRYEHPKRLTVKAVALAVSALDTIGAEAMRLGGFTADSIGVNVRKAGGFITFTNALGTIAQHKVAAAYIRSQGAYFGFSYDYGDGFTTTRLMYPATVPDHEANRECEQVTKLLAKRQAVGV